MLRHRAGQTGDARSNQLPPGLKVTSRLPDENRWRAKHICLQKARLSFKILNQGSRALSMAYN